MWKDKHLDKLTLKNLILLITYTILCILAMIRLDQVWKFLSMVFSLLKPFMLGFVFAYIFNIPMQFFYEKINIKKQSVRKGMAQIASLLCIVGLFVFMISIVMPQFIESITSLVQEFPYYVQSSENILLVWMEKLGLNHALIEQYDHYSTKIEETLLTTASSILPTIFSLTKNIISTFTDMILSFVIAIYFILTKDLLLVQVKKTFYALLSENIYLYLLKVVQLSHRIFSGFISGQILEAMIVGVLCYVGVSVLQLSYAPILAVLLGCSNIVPIFGPIIGTFIGGMLLLFVNPWQALIFIIFALVLQQFEANLIYPKVVGNSIGLSGMWVLLAVSVGGGLFKVSGLIFGLPVFAVLYHLFANFINEKTRDKEKKRVESVE